MEDGLGETSTDPDVLGGTRDDSTRLILVEEVNVRLLRPEVLRRVVEHDVQQRTVAVVAVVVAPSDERPEPDQHLLGAETSCGDHVRQASPADVVALLITIAREATFLAVGV